MKIHRARTDLVDIVLLAERVKHDVDLVEHVHHLHGCDVDADLIELDHIAEEDGHIREDLRYKQTKVISQTVSKHEYYVSIYHKEILE